MQNENIEQTKQAEHQKGLISAITNMVTAAQDIELLIVQVNSLAQEVQGIVSKISGLESSLSSLGDNASDATNSLHLRLTEVERFFQDLLPSKGLSFSATPPKAISPGSPESPASTDSAPVSSSKPRFLAG